MTGQQEQAYQDFHNVQALNVVVLELLDLLSRSVLRRVGSKSKNNFSKRMDFTREPEMVRCHVRVIQLVITRLELIIQFLVGLFVSLDYVPTALGVALSLQIVENLGEPFDAHRATVDVLESQRLAGQVEVAYPTVHDMLVEVGPASPI